MDYVNGQPEFEGRVFAEKLVGQGQRDGTMTNVQQENTLRHFRAGNFLATRCFLSSLSHVV